MNKETFKKAFRWLCLKHFMSIIAVCAYFIPTYTMVTRYTKLLAPEQALYNAAETGNSTTVRTLLKQGVNANTRWGGDPVLSVAVRNGHNEVIKLLLDHGADINAKDMLKSTALIQAVFYNNLNTAQLLLERGANVNLAENYDGTTALMQAVKKNNLNLVQLLLRYQAHSNAQDHAGTTALMYAVMNNHPALIELLLQQQGLQLNMRNNMRQTALDIAKQLAATKRDGYQHIITLLEAHGAHSSPV